MLPFTAAFLGTGNHRHLNLCYFSSSISACY